MVLMFHCKTRILLTKILQDKKQKQNKNARQTYVLAKKKMKKLKKDK